MAGVYQWFWSESFWLGNLTTWEDLKNNSTDVYKPQLADIIYSSSVFGILLLCLRFVVERYFLYPVGLSVGVILKKCHPVEKNDVFEKVYKTEHHLEKQTIEDLMKKTSLSEREIQRWWRRRRNMDVQGPMKKFCECGWLSIYYTTMLIYGLFVLWDKPWFWSTETIFRGHPYQHVSTGLYYYYAIEMGFYISLVTSLLFDTKRKDFRNMAIHHMLTLSLMLFSWSTCHVYIGVLVLFVHDIADSWIGVAKMMKYCNKMTLCEILFGIFVVIWIITRCFVYPYWILWTTIEKYIWAKDTYIVFPYGHFNSEVLLISFLTLLQFLHWLWTYMILGIAIQKVWYGEFDLTEPDAEQEMLTLLEHLILPSVFIEIHVLKQDVRSESEAEESSADEEKKSINEHSVKQAANNNATGKFN